MSEIIRLKCPAKINLTLDILGKDELSGKHFVNTILYRDDNFFDEMVLTKSDTPENTISCEHPDVPTDRSNLALRALDVLGEGGWNVALQKHIPTGSGLGGGSSNAGVILRHFGKARGIPELALREMAASLGSDVPFFTLEDNLAYCEGFGDQLVQAWSADPLSIHYHQTGVCVSTAVAYAQLDLVYCGRRSGMTEALLLHLNQFGVLPGQLQSYLHNDFEAGFFRTHSALIGSGRLCGSGGMLWQLA
ncbi:MAG: hypothetical protein Q8P95_00595 [bacterium]|nr:hypothetical protein [bacterium]